VRLTRFCGSVELVAAPGNNLVHLALLCAQHSSRYCLTQVRTLQRHIVGWKALHGPEQEIIFEQWHIPGERGQSDFTYMDDLGIMSAALPMKMGMWNKRTNTSKMLPIRHCERGAVKIPEDNGSYIPTIQRLPDQGRNATRNRSTSKSRHPLM
jgi:hypothetical protein